MLFLSYIIVYLSFIGNNHFFDRRGTRTHHLQLRRLTLYPHELVCQGVHVACPSTIHQW